jgi:signal transduction histidine kinase
MAGATSAPDDRGRSAAEARDARIDHTVVRLATVAAGMFYALLLGTWIIGGERQFLLQSLTPFGVAGVGIVMLRSGRAQPVLQIVIGSVGLIFYVSVADADTPGDPLIGLLVMAIAGAVLVRRHRVAFVVVAALVLGVAGFAWQPPSELAGERVVLAFSVVVAFAFTAILVGYLKSQSAADQARLAELVASKDEFVASVSHELRTPLTAVVGLAHELKARHGEFTQDEIREFTSLLVSESSDIADIVEDLLVAARADLGSLTLDIRTVDVTAIVQVVLGDLAGHAPEAVDEPHLVDADPLRLRQIIRNLVGNAVRYGGDQVRVITSSDGATVSVEVRDDGRPLPAEDRVEIFEAYRRAGAVDGKPGSVGLGLTVSRRLARLMGGDVTYDHDGAETVFTLRLPVARETAGVDREDAA